MILVFETKLRYKGGKDQNMLIVKTKELLQNVVKRCTRIEEIVNKIDKESFDSSDDIKEIIFFNLILIHELIECLDKDIVTQYRGISWNKMKEIRNVIDHDYDNTDFDKVWLTVTIDVKPLREYCEKILKEN